MQDTKFIAWLRDSAKKADDEAHNFDLNDGQRNLAWGRATAYFAVLEKLGVGYAEPAAPKPKEEGIGGKMTTF